MPLKCLDHRSLTALILFENLSLEPWDEMASTLALIDVVRGDALGAKFLTGTTDMHEAAKIHASMGPREAGIWAAAVTSLKMEHSGPFNRCVKEVEVLIQDKYDRGSAG